jgi:polysaccharide export outer membrane protein
MFLSRPTIKAACFFVLCCGLHGQTPEPTQSLSQYVLGPDDQIKVWALGVEEVSDKPVRIDPGGDIDLPVAGKVHAAGLTLEELKASLIRQFSASLLDPKVSVEIVDFGSQPVSVMGAVNHPGVLQLRGRKTLAEVISLADGLRQDAGPRVSISRQIRYGAIPLRDAKPDATGEFSVATVHLKSLMAGASPAENILISPHDVISVPAAELVYVVGDVKKPGEVALKDRDTISVLQALSSAEGYGPTPAPQNAKLVRAAPDGKERTEIHVNLQKIMAGKGEDIAMRPNDILVVPPSAPKKVALRVVEAAIATVTGIVIWRRP